MPRSRTTSAIAAAAATVISVLTLTSCAAPVAPPSPSASRSTVDRAMQATPSDLARRFVTTFNDGDARALAALFTTDAEFVNIYGLRMSGRDGIERGHATAFASRLDGASLRTTRVDEQRIDADLVIVQLLWRLERDPDADPALVVPDSAGVLTFTAHRGDDGWRFVAGANVTESTPPS